MDPPAEVQTRMSKNRPNPSFRATTVFKALLGLCAAGIASHGAAAAGAQTADTCTLKSPPPQARRVPTHGVDFLIWPPQIDAAFTGCQKVWLEDGHLLGTTVFKRGQVQSFSSREPGSDTTLRCNYKTSSKKKPLPDDCPAREDFPLWASKP